MVRKILLTVLLVAATATVSFGQNIAGTWAASFETQVGTQEYTYIFALDGTTLTGTATSVNGEVEITAGAVNGNEITFVENLNYEGMPLQITYTGTLAGDEIQFTRDVAGIAMEELVARRQ
jgi:hypothetical protein